jgi:predicted nucleic acid-binding protein
MVYVVDTNVLLRFTERRHPLHPTVRTAVRRLRLDGHQLQVTPRTVLNSGTLQRDLRLTMDLD